MRRPRRGKFLAALLAVVWLSSCAGPTARRLQPEDVITLRVTLPEPWLAGRLALLTVRLEASGPGDACPITLRESDVPTEATGRVTVAFFCKQQILSDVLELPLRADC